MASSMSESALKEKSAVRNRPNAIIVNACQKGNPVLKHIRNVAWEFGEIVPDYEVGRTTCVLFLSLRYHRLHPNYIYERLKPLGKNYTLRILLIVVDIPDHEKSLRELSRVSIGLDYSIILSWSSEEAARYLETFKCFEAKPADLIREKVSEDYVDRLTECLTCIKSVNKTDALTLATNFMNLGEIATLSKTDLELCPGFGESKIRRFLEAMEQPFLIQSDVKHAT